MAFTTVLKGRDNWGAWLVTWGTYASAGGSTGGDFNTGLGNLNALFLQEKGSSAINDVSVVNETFPDADGSAATIVTAANQEGTWVAFGGQKIEAITIDEVTVFGVTVFAGKKWIIGLITDGGDGAVEAVLTRFMNTVEVMKLQPIDTAILANAPAINETFPEAASGITIACTASKSYVFLAGGV
jgi:hypothetical protein